MTKVNTLEVLNIQTKEEFLIDDALLVHMDQKSWDIIISVPHSGIFIPQEFSSHLNLGRPLLIDTDLYVDELVSFDKGVTIKSELAVHLVNMSRSKEVSEGPKHLQGTPLNTLGFLDEPIYVKENTDDEKEYLLTFYDKYHALLAQAIKSMKQNKGYALIIDCHASNLVGLKNTPDEGESRPDVCVGTLDDTSADSRIIDAVCSVFRENGIGVRKNDPYRGGFITQHYGNPAENVHVIQLEMKKALWMNECLESGDSFAKDDRGVRRMNQILKNVFEAAAKAL